MGKNKLRKFSDMEQFERVYQYPFAVLQRTSFPFRGKWNEEVFRNSNPIVLELGCGKGEYTVGLARLYPEKNFIGIDIKGARIWTGAKEMNADGILNAAFLRTSVELLPEFFAPGEVSEIWITFPDPQMKKVRKRLTSTTFLEIYRKVLKPNGIIHLKSDSPFLFTYTSLMLEHNSLEPVFKTVDLYAIPDHAEKVPDIKTHYERQWLDRGLTIKYIAFPLPDSAVLSEPECEIEPDTYRSYSRGEVQCPQLMNNPKVTLKNADPIS